MLRREADYRSLGTAVGTLEMQKIGCRVRVGLLGTVVSVLAFGGERAEAAPILTIDYSGTVDEVYGPGGAGPDHETGLHIGDLIVGTLTIDPVVEAYTSTTETETTPPLPTVTTL